MDKSLEIKTTYVAILMLIGNADGKTDEWEERYIDTIASRLNIESSLLSAIKTTPHNYIGLLPDTLAQRIEFFYNLLFMMGINNEITQEEKELCKKIGFRLCFNPMLMDDLIVIVSKNLGRDVPVNDVVNAVIKYQN
ncbi:MAG: hypothetical protein JXB34_13855 [Bacteroidales bacterium]|nr:hypothetical protein [Bacteroidales bacterium]